MEIKFLKAISLARRFLYDLIVPLSIGFVLVAVGTYFVLQSVPLVQGAVIMTPSGQQVEVVTDHQIFRDVLQFVLAIAAIGLAAFGYGAYKILSSQIEDKVIDNAETRYQKSLAYQRVSFAYLYWLLYENSKDQPKTAEMFLNKAIEHTRRAYEEQVVHLNSNAPEVERLICQIRNNLAYYVSERHINIGPVESSTQAESLSFVKWLESRIEYYPSETHIFRHTIDTVRERFLTSNKTVE